MSGINDGVDEVEGLEGVEGIEEEEGPAESGGDLAASRAARRAFRPLSQITREDSVGLAAFVSTWGGWGSPASF